MSTIVKNIKRVKHPIHKDTLDIAKKAGVLHLIPTKIPISVSLELHNTTTELANAIRRTINTEVDVLRLNVMPVDIDTNDDYIIKDLLIKNINHLKIEQIRNGKFKINIRNDTDRTIDVYSRDIKDIDEKNKKRPFDDTVAMIELNSGKYLKVNNIFTESGSVYSRDHASFSFEHTCRYKCPDIKMSSMYCEPSKYILEIPRQKFIDPIEIFKINEETYTIGYLLTKYIYLTDPTIQKVACLREHPTDRFILVEVHHVDAKKITSIAIDRIKKELSKILTSLI